MSGAAALTPSHSSPNTANAALAKDAGLQVNRGIVVDHGMRTSDPDILALGECAEVGGHVYGLVAPLYEMARVAAARLLDDDAAAFWVRRGFLPSRDDSLTLFRSIADIAASIELA